MISLYVNSSNLTALGFVLGSESYTPSANFFAIRIASASISAARNAAVVSCLLYTSAKRRGMPRSMGHRAGADVLKQIVIAADEIGIRALTVYGFSTENWKRPEQEVSLLMALIKEYLNNNVKYMHEHNVRIRFIGFIGGLSEDLQKIIQDAELLTQNNTGLTLQLAINYGGRDEIVRTIRDIVKSVANGVITMNKITEEYVSSQLFSNFVHCNNAIRCV